MWELDVSNGLTQTAMSLNTISLKTFLFSLPVKSVHLVLGWSWILLIDLDPSFTKASSELGWQPLQTLLHEHLEN